MRRLLLASLAALAPALVLGCTDAGGTAGMGGAAGTAGIGGDGGSGGAACGESGGPRTSCLSLPTDCTNITVQPVEPCCEPPAPPSQAAACRGDESLENPAGCSSTGTTTIHRLTSLKVAPDCNVGFDLDSCDGVTCRLGPLASEGLDGVDNVAATIELHGGVNQLFADAICGRTNRNGLGCDTEIASLDLELAIEENPSERCANVVVFASGSEVNRVTLNLGEPVPGGTRCLSGTLGPVPLNLGEIEISLASTLIRMTVSDAGFSDGLLGGTIHANETLALAEAAMPELGPDIHEYLDICDDLSFAPATPCNALSGSYEIGGVARHGGPQLGALAPRLEGTAGALQ